MAASQSATADITVVRSGYLKKLKTNKKKFFVLRAESAESSARLEYYDTQRKYTHKEPPKRCVNLKSCFNINRRLDTKHKHVIALYTKDDCFCIVLESEQDLERWLKDLLSLQQGEELVEGEIPKPNFEHVWQVHVVNRGLGTIGLIGLYRLCLTEETLTLISVERDTHPLVFILSNIRSCGHLGCFIFIEVGRSSPLGAGEVWMLTEDSFIARNILLYITQDKRYQRTMSHALKSEEAGTERRWRALPTTESSKRKLLNVLFKTQMLFQVKGVTSFYQLLFQRGTPKATERRHSISAGSEPPGLSHQRTQSLPLANPAPISDQIISQPLRSSNVKRFKQSLKCMADGPHRGRSGTLPPITRSRTTSEGNPAMMFWNGRPHFHSFRPTTVYRSHSPPLGSPVSPPSAGGSTDSAGSSYSLADETDLATEHDHPNISSRFGHCLTPDEAIAEEDYSDSPLCGTIYVPMTLPSDDDGYVEMSPKGNHHNNSPTTSLSNTLTIGNPSGDMRFVEYPLEKVTSYFPPSEDDDARPTRAYSVGSRPECQKKYLELLTSSNNENLRVRALSVGSKTKKVLGRVLPSHGYHSHHGSKSSSAPLLSNVRGPGSHTSIGPMGDLMEMDFSRSGSINNSGYMEMRGAGLKTNNRGYVPMKPGVVTTTNRGKVENSPYVDMSSGSSPARPSLISPSVEHNGLSNDYMEMDPRKNSNNNNNSTDYLTMSFNSSSTDRHSNINYQLSPVKTSLPYGSPYGSPKTEPPTPDGYVEMSLGRSGHHQRQSSLDSAQIVNEDYANMSMGKKRDRNFRKKDKARSQPIAIQNSSNNTSKNNGGGASSSSPRYALLTRKFSTGTPPTMHLPLTLDSSSYGSLPRQKSRKNSRRDSKDSSSSSINTPSSSSTIFPFSLNSPCSPIKSEITSAPSTTIKVPAGVLAAVYKKPNKTDSDYTPMNFCKSSSNQSDYVNYNPAKTTPVDEDDYAVMKPGQVRSGVVLTSRTTAADSAASFRPIKENKDDSSEKSSEQPYEVLKPRSRPASVTESIRSSLSRPSSTSSELYSACSSSGSTIVGSRPDSANSDRVRPPSTDVVQLHYASLDLEEGNRSPRSLKGGESSSGQVEATLTYAAIDFVKSEGLKHNSLTSNTNKVKH